MNNPLELIRLLEDIVEDVARGERFSQEASNYCESLQSQYSEQSSRIKGHQRNLLSSLSVLSKSKKKMQESLQVTVGDTTLIREESSDLASKSSVLASRVNTSVNQCKSALRQRGEDKHRSEAELSTALEVLAERKKNYDRAVVRLQFASDKSHPQARRNVEAAKSAVEVARVGVAHAEKSLDRAIELLHIAEDNYSLAESASRHSVEATSFSESCTEHSEAVSNEVASLLKASMTIKKTISILSEVNEQHQSCVSRVRDLVAEGKNTLAVVRQGVSKVADASDRAKHYLDDRIDRLNEYE